MSDMILRESDGTVMRITLNRPENGNLVSNEMGAELAQMLLAAADDCQMVVLRGAGENFCLGRDTRGLAEGGPPSALDVRDNNTGPALDVYASFRDCRVPIIGVIHGAAHGFGCAVAGLCDITIAADDASFKVPEMDRDLPPALVMSALSDRVLRKAITYLVYSRAEVDADTALTMGIVSTVVPAADLDEEIEALVATLSDNSATSLITVKDYMRHAPDMDRRAASDFASNLLSNVLSSK